MRFAVAADSSDDGGVPVQLWDFHLSPDYLRHMQRPSLRWQHFVGVVVEDE
mgnify:FL=1